MFYINAGDWGKASKQYKLFECMMRTKEDLPDKAERAVRVSVDRLGRVFLCVVKEVEVTSDNQTPSSSGSFYSTVALDPSVCTFQTMYDADGCEIEWSEDDMKTIFVMCCQADNIQSKMAKKRAT